MKRSRTPGYVDRAVFGVPLVVSQQRHGQPLPQCVLYAMRRLRRAAADAVGVFRKSGVRTRVAALRQELEADPGQSLNHPPDTPNLSNDYHTGVICEFAMT